ncbi:TonB-dependent receptor [Salinibacter altiplanensis]|uniref:TonB-dependent receptor n=1 Tax=Salinibacter altiplanensis TaxID=1803181 RepID=UPI001F34A9C8|nr:TonB-dependent receptor [Salinibacter altiplanensis]
MFTVVLIVLLGSGPDVVVAQDAASAGAVAGVVVEKGQGEPLPGANVTVEGTSTGTSTDLEGRYRLDGLAPGTYALVVSFVGFQQTTVTGVEVTAGQTTSLDVALAAETEQLDEVVVSAEAARDSEAGLLKERAEAAALSDAVSAEMIGRAGAGTVAGAMSMVTGASVTEGKYVNVRGLQGRYVSTKLNGSTLPSTDPDGNSVALDLFPSSLIDNVVTRKTFTPDRPGSFTGGSIDITTKAFPEERFATLSVSSSLNSEVGIGGEVLRPIGGVDDVPAIAQGDDLPGSLVQTFNDDQRAQQINQLTRAFATSVTPTRKERLGNWGAEASFGDRFSVLGGRSLGLIASLTYDQSVSGYEDGTTARFEQTGSLSENLNPTARYTTQRGLEETLLGGMAGLSFQLASQHELGLRLLYNRSREEEARLQEGQLPRDLTGDHVFRTRVLRTTERTMQSGELDGTHQFGAGQEGVRVNWKASLSEAERDEPDYRFFSNHCNIRDGEERCTIAQSIYKVPSRFFRNLTETDGSGRVSVEVPLGPATLKTGGRYRTTAREFRERRFDHLSDQVGYSGNPDRYIDEQAGLVEDDDRGRNRFGTYVLDQTQTSNNYDGDQTVGAGFLTAELPVPGLPSLEFIGGVRVEHTDMSIATIKDDPQRGQFTETDLLPSVNLVWSLRDDMNLRGAYGRTIAQPSFREFAPFSSFNFVGDYIEVGNPDLTRTRIDNFDLRWEWFSGPGELLSAGVYYKEFDNPIERTINPRASGANVEVTYDNKSSARVYGVELEARKNLGGLASWLRHVQVGGNLTLIESEISRTERALDALRAFQENPSDTRPLQGQSPFLVNLNAGYQNPNSGTSVNVFVHRFGDRLQTVTRNGVDLYEQGRSMLDVNASQRLLRGVTVKASVENVLDSEEVVSQSFRGNEFVNDRRPLGRTISVGVSYEF